MSLLRQQRSPQFSTEATLIGLLSQSVQQQQQDRQVLQKLLLSELQPEEQEVELERKK